MIDGPFTVKCKGCGRCQVFEGSDLDSYNEVLDAMRKAGNDEESPTWLCGDCVKLGVEVCLNDQ